MKAVNRHETKSQLSKLIAEARRGKSFVIARAEKPLVKATETEGATRGRTGFLKGQVEIPDDFDRLGEHEILPLFEGREDGARQGA